MAKIILLNAVATDYDNVRFIPYPLLYLKSYLQANGHSIEIIDFQSGKKSVRRLKQTLNNHPDILGISVFAGNGIHFGIKASIICKKISPQTIIVFGGILPTLCPEIVLKDTLADYVIQFEGEETLLQLANAVDNNQKNISLPNLITRYHSEKYSLNQRQRMNLQHALPISFEDVSDKKYVIKTKRYGEKGVSIFTSKGCPYNCSFCYNNAYNAGLWRPFPVQWVLDTIDKLVKTYNIDVLFVFDDNFFVQYDRVIDILEGTRKIGHDIKWWAELRVDQALSISIRQYERLYDLGLRELYISPESGSDNVLKILNKGFTVKDIILANEHLSNTKLDISYSLMVGIPGETYEEMMATIDLSIALRDGNKKASIWGINNYLPYPGTVLYEKAINSGFCSYNSLSDLLCRFDYKAPHLPWTQVSKGKQEMIGIASTFQKSDKVINALPFWKKSIAKLSRYVFEYRLRHHNFIPFFDFWFFKAYFKTREFMIKMMI